MENCISNWIQLLDKALERERWGQIVETKQCYETLLKQIKAISSTSINEDDIVVFGQCVYILNQLIDRLNHPQTVLSHNDNTHCCNSSIRELLQSVTSGTTTIEQQQQIMIITINRISITDPDWIVQPFISISIRRNTGNHIEQVYDTDYSTIKEGNYIIFNEDITLKTPFNQIPKDSNVVFELKHYNPNQRLIAVKSYSILNIQDIVQGSLALELLTYKRSSIFNIFSRRQKQYLYINIRFQQTKK